MTNFVFDVDGTLTNARETIDPVFEEFMYDFLRIFQLTYGQKCITIG